MALDLPNPLKADAGNPIIIYQMGKVGSSSVFFSLNQHFKGNKQKPTIHQIHTLNFNNDTEEQVNIRGALRADAKDTLTTHWKSKELRQFIDQNPHQRWTLISLVREPVARNIATFFQNLHEHLPNWKKLMIQDDLTIVNLQELFLKNENHKLPAVWFDDQMKTVWDIDVYSTPFPYDRGYQFHQSAKADLLLIRLEDLSKAARPALETFLGVDGFELLDSNIGETKDYKLVYAEFRKLPLPNDYIDSMYATKYATHFYTAAEIERFKSTWKSKIASQILPETSKIIKDQIISDLEEQVVQLSNKTRTQHKDINRLWELIKAKDKGIGYLASRIKEKLGDKRLVEKNQVIEHLTLQVKEKDRAIEHLTLQVKEKDRAIEHLASQVRKNSGENSD